MNNNSKKIYIYNFNLTSVQYGAASIAMYTYIQLANASLPINKENIHEFGTSDQFLENQITVLHRLITWGSKKKKESTPSFEANKAVWIEMLLVLGWEAFYLHRGKNMNPSASKWPSTKELTLRSFCMASTSCCNGASRPSQDHPCI